MREYFPVCLVVVLFLGMAISASPISQKTGYMSGALTFEKRVAAQQAIERVYYEHRIWPKENPDPKPAFEQMMPRVQIEAKVSDYLKMSAALEAFWKAPITADQLQAELDRMTRNTKDPATLAELFAALNNDAYLIAECLARSLLADRIIRNLYAYDARFHGELKAEAQALRDRLTPANFSDADAGHFHAVKIARMDRASGRDEESLDSTALKLEEVDFNKAAGQFPEAGTVSQIEETAEAFIIRWTESRRETSLEGGAIVFEKRPFDAWFEVASRDLSSDIPATEEAYTLRSLAAAETLTDPISPESWKALWYVPEPRYYHTAVWTGTEMIVWGGGTGSSGNLNTGGRYNPSTDSWVATSTGTNCPSARQRHTAVWTGTEMIVWGGYNGSYLNSGGQYTPSSDSWTATSTGTSCPSIRYYHTAVWTGTEMIIWGGYSGSYLNTGGRYAPSSDSWTVTSTGTNCPSARRYHTSTWTGAVMIVWGGNSGSYLNSGGQYTPSSDSWTATSTGTNCPSIRYYHTAVWTGTEMIIWGGYNGSYLNNGGRYTPSSDSWIATSTGTNCPSTRYYHTAVWTGTEMIVWGGYNGSYLNNGGRYTPSSDSWIATSTGTNCPSARQQQTAVWTGTVMIVWGGYNGSYLNTGGRYTPSSDSWTATSTGTNCPAGRYDHTAVWTGTEMIIWGGYYGSYLNTGGRYAPSSDSWIATSPGTNCPSARRGHTAVWTGTVMIVWGGIYNGSLLNTGGRYTPSSDSWTATSTGTNCPSARDFHTAVWKGGEMIVFGGASSSTPAVNTGGRYNPTSDTWKATSTGTNCPSARYLHTAVWTGREMIVWGGYNGTSNDLNTGGRYAPSSDSWIATSTGANCPSTRQEQKAVWMGTEMIVWGGIYNGSFLNTGGRYTPSSDSWIATSTGTNCPSGRQTFTAVWTGMEMIVWGGYRNGSYLNTGGRYTPSSDSWMATSTGANCPSARYYHTAVWTGTTMIVWDGNPTTQNGGVYYPNTPPRSLPALSTSLGGDTIFNFSHGETLSLNGSASTDGSNPYTTTPYHDELDSIVLYEWDLNGDANFATQCATSASGVDLTGATPSVLGDSDLVSLGISAPGSHAISLRVTDEAGAMSCSSTTLTVSPCTFPGAPVITGITDNDPCAASGITVVYTAGSGAVNHNLLKDGVTVVTGYASGATYIPGDTRSHTYYVQAVNATCSMFSTAMAGTDASPGAPVITSIVDPHPSVQDGIKIYYTPAGGASSHNLYKDGVLVVTGYVSGSTYNPGNTSAHSYVVSAVNGTCSTNSAALPGTDSATAHGTPPTEVAPGYSFSTAQAWADTATTTWPSVTGATYYTLYRGTLSDLPKLLNSGTDSCVLYAGIATSATDVSDPSMVTGNLYWYLVTASDAYGEGSAGNTTSGARIVNSTGACSQ